MSIEPAPLCFAADGTPFSPVYADVYHSAAGPFGQAEHVFLAGNGLPQRWRGADEWVILETGFGLGLNFLATWQAWRSDPEAGRYLRFVSVEKHPFSARDLARAHSAWPELGPLSAQLCAGWPDLEAGQHRLEFDGGRVVLSLVFGDAAEQLPALELQVDAFYLDGFSPAKNPELWSPELCHVLGRLAKPSATLATWSVAGAVRRALSDAGFVVEKSAGYGSKRQMLVGRRF